MTELLVVDVPIAEVLVLEDRAQVRRKGMVEVQPGRSRLCLENLSAILVDKTAFATFGVDSVKVLDSYVERTERILDEELHKERTQKIELEVDDLRKQRDELVQKLDDIRAQQERLEKWAKIVCHEIIEDVQWGQFSREVWADNIESIREQEQKFIFDGLSLQKELDELATKIKDYEHQLNATKTPSTLMQTSIFVEIESANPEVFEVVFELEYVVGAACWRPYHTAYWLDDDRLEFSTDACIWQNTGEDWNNVQLLLSTERPSLGSSPPKLSSDVLYTTKKSSEVVVEVREQEVQTVGLGTETRSESVKDTKAATSSQFPGIDDGGEVRYIPALHKASIPSDGRAYRVNLASFESPMTWHNVLAAELVPSAIVRSQQSNQGQMPILPGPVDLIRRGGIIGRTVVKYFAQDEQFYLGWGPDPIIRVQRQHRELKEHQKTLSQWIHMPRIVDIYLSNIGAEPRKIEVTERVLVSEHEKLKVAVEVDKTTGNKEPDKDGFIKWDVELSANTQHHLVLSYVITKHSSVHGI